MGTDAQIVRPYNRYTSVRPYTSLLVSCVPTPGYTSDYSDTSDSSDKKGSSDISCDTAVM